MFTTSFRNSLSSIPKGGQYKFVTCLLTLSVLIDRSLTCGRIEVGNTFAKRTTSLHTALPHTSRISVNARCLQFLLIREDTAALAD